MTKDDIRKKHKQGQRNARLALAAANATQQQIPYCPISQTALVLPLALPCCGQTINWKTAMSCQRYRNMCFRCPLCRKLLPPVHTMPVNKTIQEIFVKDFNTLTLADQIDSLIQLVKYQLEKRSRDGLDLDFNEALVLLKKCQAPEAPALRDVLTALQLLQKSKKTVASIAGGASLVESLNNFKPGGVSQGPDSDATRLNSEATDATVEAPLDAPVAEPGATEAGSGATMAESGATEAAPDATEAAPDATGSWDKWYGPTMGLLGITFGVLSRFV